LNAARRHRKAWGIAIPLIVAAVCYFVGIEHGRHSISASHIPHAVEVKETTGGRVPAEFEHQDALLLGFNELYVYHRETMVEIVRAIVGNIRIIGLVSDEAQRAQVHALLTARGIDTSNIEYFIWPTAMMWVQDFGPTFVVNEEATAIAFDFHHPNTDFENMLPVAFASQFGFPINHAHMSLDGGNLLSNGEGLCLSTSTVLQDNAAREFKLEDIGQRLHKYLHFDKWTYLKPLVGEPTGHVDMFATFVAPNVVVVGSCDPAGDPVNAAILDDNAVTLSKVVTRAGPLRVERVRKPTHEDGKWFSYANVIFANGVLLVPQYPGVSSELDRDALVLYRRLLPDWKVVGIDCTSLIAKRGALHCVSLNIPKLPANVMP
jgi:agmatine/peptidylarginine deiminase